MLPPELSNLKFDKTLYNKVVKFLKENDPEMIYIYGGDDPWTASGVTWLKNKKNIKVYVLPGGSIPPVSAALTPTHKKKSRHRSMHG